MFVIVALAGRRVDPKDQSPARFPNTPESMALVRRRIREVLISLRASTVVSSAACGADLLGLTEAGKLDLHRRVILPTDRETFRSTSVTDRGGDWGTLYDTVLRKVELAGDLVIVHAASKDLSYVETNHRIIDESFSLGNISHQEVAAVRVWEGQSRGDGDFTEEFGNYALSKGVPVFEVLTQ